MLKVGCVKYINAFPFTLPFRLNKIQSDVEFAYSIPSKLNCLLRSGQLDAALTSSVEYLDGEYQMIPGFGITGFKSILSVNLYTQVPISSLSGMRVGVTHHSATSVALLKVLCHHLWKIEPRLEPLNREETFSNYAAFLLIGDEALENLSIPGFQTIDLGAAWHSLTDLPFVFAVFAIRNGIPSQKITLFQKQLDAALEWSEANKKIVKDEALKQCSLTTKLVHQYYSVLQYRLGEQEMKSLETFKKLRIMSDVSKICS
jgi:putative periplasmic solute-binding protein